MIPSPKKIRNHKYGNKLISYVPFCPIIISVLLVINLNILVAPIPQSVDQMKNLTPYMDLYPTYIGK